MLATILQTPKRFFFACKIVASAKKSFFSFARLLQTPKRFFFACKIVASAKKFFFPFARLLQAPQTTFFDLQDCCKHYSKGKSPGERGMGSLSPGGGSDPKKNPVIPYFSGTASRVATSRRHDFSTEAMPTASSGECGCVMSGPNEIMSMSG